MPEHAQAESILKRFQQLESGRHNWDSHRQEIAEITWPDAADFTSRHAPGEKRARKVFDATAALSLEKFAAMLESFLTPRASIWHRLKTTLDELNEDQDVKEWFDTLNQILFDGRSAPRANYYSQMHEIYKSLGAFGDGCMFVDAHPDGGVRYQGRAISRVWIDVNPEGIVDTAFYKYPLSHKAAFQKWGKLIPPKVQTGLAEKPFEEMEYLHVVLPRLEVDPFRIDSGGMRWESFDISMEEKIIIDEGGYHEFPYLYSRYTVNPAERYGRSPLMLVHPANLTLQEMEKTHLRAGHKVADPPLLLHDDGILGGGSAAVILRPGGLNWGGLNSQGKEMIKPLHTGARLDITEGMMDKKRQAINEALSVSLFQILEENPGEMTATEVLERAREKGILLGPLVGRQQSELLGPQVEREINILVRQGRVPPMPDALLEADGEYKIEYESQATSLQKSEVILAMQQAVDSVRPFAEIDPSAYDIFKPHAIGRLAAEALNVPQKALRSDDELEELREAAQQQAQEAALAEQAPQVAGALKDVASASESFGGASA